MNEMWGAPNGIGLGHQKNEALSPAATDAPRTRAKHRPPHSHVVTDPEQAEQQGRGEVPALARDAADTRAPPSPSSCSGLPAHPCTPRASDPAQPGRCGPPCSRPRAAPEGQAGALCDPRAGAGSAWCPLRWRAP